jgi:hypothetical protein
MMSGHRSRAHHLGVIYSSPPNHRDLTAQALALSSGHGEVWLLLLTGSAVNDKSADVDGERRTDG